jgi:hypothetical protein
MKRKGKPRKPCRSLGSAYVRGFCYGLLDKPMLGKGKRYGGAREMYALNRRVWRRGYYDGQRVRAERMATDLGGLA